MPTTNKVTSDTNNNQTNSTATVPTQPTGDHSEAARFFFRRVVFGCFQDSCYGSCTLTDANKCLSWVKENQDRIKKVTTAHESALVNHLLLHDESPSLDDILSDGGPQALTQELAAWIDGYKPSFVDSEALERYLYGFVQERRKEALIRVLDHTRAMLLKSDLTSVSTYRDTSPDMALSYAIAALQGLVREDDPPLPCPAQTQESPEGMSPGAVPLDNQTRAR